MRVARSRELVAQGRPAAMVARVAGISRQAIYRRSKRPPAGQRRRLDRVDRVVLAVAQANPTDGTRMVAAGHPGGDRVADLARAVAGEDNVSVNGVAGLLQVLHRREPCRRKQFGAHSPGSPSRARPPGVLLLGVGARDAEQRLLDRFVVVGGCSSRRRRERVLRHDRRRQRGDPRLGRSIRRPRLGGTVVTRASTPSAGPSAVIAHCLRAASGARRQRRDERRLGPVVRRSGVPSNRP
jgi:hypothetical protein